MKGGLLSLRLILAIAFVLFPFSTSAAPATNCSNLYTKLYESFISLWSPKDVETLRKDGASAWSAYSSAILRLRSIPIPDRARSFRHSSLVQGVPVAAAGTISIDELGNIVQITRDSGHYIPKKKQLEQFVSRLKEIGVDLSRAEIIHTVQK